MRPIAAVVFDLDDTLIDWWGSIERCLNGFAPEPVVRALQEYCRRECWEFRPGSTDVWHRNTWALHHHREDHWPAALAHLDETEVRDLMQRFDTSLWVDFFPETVATLEALGPICRLAVMSNNQLLPAEVERLGLDRWFERSIAAPRDRPKPAPDAFLAVARELGVSPAACAYVGDSVRADVLGARAAGMVPVWLNRWADAWPDRPGRVIEIASLAELPALVASRR